MWDAVDQAINALQATMGVRIKGAPVTDKAILNGYATAVPAAAGSAVAVPVR